MSDLPRESENTGDEVPPRRDGRVHGRGSGRERVLDAYAALLNEQGVAGATLDEVAKRAEISKGGLLHHFGSKDALIDGLLQRLAEQNDSDMRRSIATDADPVAAYLRSSMEASDDVSVTLLALLKLAGSNIERVDQTISDMLNSWHTVIAEQVDDPILARIIHLVGDGLYLHAIIGDQVSPVDEQVIQRVIEWATGPLSGRSPR